jgi:hypothetical protein
MERRTLAQAFDEPFTAGEEILRKERAGAGVGLHMARQLVVQHGGILWADPIPAGGTRVSFCLPHHVGERVAVQPNLDLPPADGAETETPNNVVPFVHPAAEAASSS